MLSERTVIRSGSRPESMPETEEIERLYRVASQGPPLYETEETAALFARIYGVLRDLSDLVAVESRQDGHLVGFAYGHPWKRDEEQDPWSMELIERLGDAAHLLDGSFVVYLVVVDPAHQRTGLGRELLRDLLDSSGAERAWLQTRDEESPAMALYLSEGWEPIGYGPEAPNGLPGRVLLWK